MADSGTGRLPLQGGVLPAAPHDACGGGPSTSNMRFIFQDHASKGGACAQVKHTCMYRVLKLMLSLGRDLMLRLKLMLMLVQ